MRAIEAANPYALTGVFGDADWTNKDLLSDKVLADLVEHFSIRTHSPFRISQKTSLAMGTST